MRESLGLKGQQRGRNVGGERHGLTPYMAMETADLVVGRSGGTMESSGETVRYDMESRSGSRHARPSMTLRHERVGTNQD